VFDPWRFGQAALELDREGITVVAFPRHDARMIPASAVSQRVRRAQSSRRSRGGDSNGRRQRD
jgi:hypothetical protein